VSDGIQIKITGADTVRALLNPEKAMGAVKRAVKRGTVHVKAQIAKYPPETEANRPGRVYPGGGLMGYYQRGRGWMEPNVSREGAVAYRLRPGSASQKLGTRWTVKFEDAGLTGVAGNNASYGPYVQGDQQAWFHAARKWKTTKTVEAEEAAMVRGFFEEELNNAFFRGF